ncbi:MAG: hypothetical protein JWP81_5156 [Ferruginibacter sp.]|nr:hypothetical protein [Ferruginibacter sp.]
MKRILTFIGMALLYFSTPSCKKIMDKGPLDKISEDAIWTDINLAEAFINNQYQVLPKIGWYDWVRSYQLSVFTDEAIHKYSYHGVTDYMNGGMTPSTPTSLDVWKFHYDYILGCNRFLKNADRIPANTDIEKQKLSRLKGEAYALRAWSYMDLAARYGGVVLVTEPFSLNDDFKRQRSTFDETAQLVVNDLNAAALLLPDSYTGSDYGRFTRGATMSMKSRMLLYAASPLFNPNNDQAKWTAAKKAAKDVIDLGIYDLVGDKTTYKKLFKENQNKEMILTRGHDPVVDADLFGYFQVVEGLGGGIDGNGYCSGWSTTMVTQNLVDDFEMTDGTAFDWNNPVHKAHPYSNRDPRLYASVTIDGSPWVRDSAVQFWVCEKNNNFNTPVYTNDNFATPNPNFLVDNVVYGRNSQANPGKKSDAPQVNYIYRKSMDESYNTETEKYPFQVSWIIFRYAEILLNYAEASLEAGDEGTARTYLNKIRNRVGLPDANESGIALRERIRHERRIELCLEGHRYFDARRWKIAEDVFNKPVYGISIVKDKNSDTKIYRKFKYQDRKFPVKYYLQPIPIAEIQKSGIAQNNY